MLRAFILSLIVILSLSIRAGAVGLVDSISSPRILVDGTEYWVHTVAKGETLYAISRKYGVSQTIIAAANPQIYYGIKEGESLRIQIPAELRTRKENLEYRLHVVGVGESLYSIARLHGITVADLRTQNALHSDTLQVNTILRIPLHGGDKQQTLIYEVQKGEGLYGISRRFNVSQEALIEANSWLKERQLVLGDKLVIPQRVQGSGELNVSADQEGTQCDSITAFPKWKTLHIALMLPFELGKSQVSASDEELYDLPASSSRGVGANTRYLDFYQGLLVALNEFRLRGYHIRLSVFDTQHSPTTVQKLIQSDTLKSVDLILGPVASKNVALVSQYAAQHRVLMVSPLAGKITAAEANPYLFHANPSFYQQLRTLTLKSITAATRRILILREESIADLEMADKLEANLQEQVKRYSPQPTIEVLRYPKGTPASKLTPRLKKLLEEGGVSKIFIPSNSEPFVSDILGQLNSLLVFRRTDTVDIYGMSRWFKMRNLDLSQLGAMRVTLFSPYYIDYQRIEVRTFLENYRALYRSEPSQFAFQGYDLAAYFLHAIFKYGSDFRFCIRKCGDVPLLQNRFEFRASQEFGSYENSSLYLLQFDLERGLVPLECK